MRWMWIDRIVALDRGRRCVAVKNVSLAEEHLHDHFPAEGERPALPVMPAPLMIEGMAQTAGIMVGHARDFAEKVILAKIGKATFDRDIYPGQTIVYEAVADRIDDAGAATTGRVYLLDHSGNPRAEGGDSASGKPRAEREDSESEKPRAEGERSEPEAPDSEAPPIPEFPHAAPMGRIDLMFSHIDRNMRGLGFPEHNFVFTDQFFDLLRNSGFAD